MTLFLRKSVWIFLVVIRADVGFGVFFFNFVSVIELVAVVFYDL